MSHPQVDPELPAEGDGIPLSSASGHGFRVLLRGPASPRAVLLFLPALGVAARHYLPFADALAGHGVATAIHEWRGHGTSAVRASRRMDWGYRELLEDDLPASVDALIARFPGVPRILGGHSLGGQLAAMTLALRADAGERLWLVASGAPYWRTFPISRAWFLPSAYHAMASLAALNGALPGRTIGFGGREARGVMRDWSRTGLTGVYAGRGIRTDLEAALAAVDADVDAVRLHDDWLVPHGSLAYLLGKMRPRAVREHVLSRETLGARADHFAWMRAPAAVAAALAAGLDVPRAPQPAS